VRPGPLRREGPKILLHVHVDRGYRCSERIDLIEMTAQQELLSHPTTKRLAGTPPVTARPDDQRGGRFGRVGFGGNQGVDDDATAFAHERTTMRSPRRDRNNLDAILPSLRSIVFGALGSGCTRAGHNHQMPPTIRRLTVRQLSGLETARRRIKKGRRISGSKVAGGSERPLLAVFIDGDGHPVCSEIWLGSTADVTTLIPMIERLRRRFDVGRVGVVADRGMTTAETVAEREARHGLYPASARRPT